MGQAICQHQRHQPQSAICQGATALCKPDGFSYRLSELLRMLGTGFDRVRSVGRAQGSKICHLSSCDHRASSPQLLPNRVCSGHVVKRQMTTRLCPIVSSFDHFPSARFGTTFLRDLTGLVMLFVWSTSCSAVATQHTATPSNTVPYRAKTMVQFKDRTNCIIASQTLLNGAPSRKHARNHRDRERQQVEFDGRSNASIKPQRK